MPLQENAVVSVATLQLLVPSVSQAIAELRINQVSTMLESFLCRQLGYKIFPTTNPEQHRGDNGLFAFLERYPIVTIDEVQIAESVDTDWSRDDHRDQRGMLYRDGGWIAAWPCHRDVTADPDNLRGGFNLSFAYSGGYVLPGDGELEPNSTADVVTLVSDNAGDTGRARVRFLASGVATEEIISLNGVSSVNTAATADLRSVIDVRLLDGGTATGVITVSVGAQTLGTIPAGGCYASNPNGPAHPIPADIQQAALEALVDYVSRPNRGVKSETLPGGAKVEWLGGDGGGKGFTTFPTAFRRLSKYKKHSFAR